MNADTLNGILDALTPDRLREIILEIVNRQAPTNRSSVTLMAVIEALTHGVDLGTGSEGWRAQLRLKEAIIEVLGQIPQMRYVEGDA